MARKPEAKGPDWPREQTLGLLRRQLEELQKFRGRTYREAEHEEETWQQFTRNIIIHGFGEASANVGDLKHALWAGEHSVMGTSDHQQQLNFELRIEKLQAVLNSSIRELEAMTSPDATRPVAPAPAGETSSAASPGIQVLISHSSKDAALAQALIDLLRSGLGLLATQIRCSSVDGYRLPAGVNTGDQLRKEIKTAKVLIGLLTPNSLSSTYVLFELGARWGAGLFMIPLLVGTTAEEMRGPHAVLNALSCETEGQLIQLVEDVGRELNSDVQSVAAYLNQLTAVKALAQSLHASATQSARYVGVSGGPQPEFKLSVAAEGLPPSQVLKVTANRQVSISKLEFLFTDEMCVVSEQLSLNGDTVEIPLKQESLQALFNAPRPDRNNYDLSGPLKLGVTGSVGGKTQRYILPARIDTCLIANVRHLRITGSKDFYGGV
jgi:hypothetical protein